MRGSRVRVSLSAPKQRIWGIHAIVAQLVEHELPKLGVAGSNPVCRSSDNKQKRNVIRQCDAHNLMTFFYYPDTVPTGSGYVVVPTPAT